MPIARRRAVIAAIAALQLAAGLATSAGADDRHVAQRVFREARGYTVRIRTQITTPFLGDERGAFEGAGFLVDAARGWILTNAHVVGRSPSEIEVAFADEPFQPARKVYVDGFIDMAVLAVERIPRGRRAATLDVSGAVSIGEPIGAFGHPLGMSFTGTRGIVSGATDQLGEDLLQVDATVDHGNSGGPTIALATGKVVGIATLKSDGDKSDRVNFATPMADVGHVLELLRRGVDPSPPRLEIALLRDEDGRHLLEVGHAFAPERWPLEPGDRLLGISGRRRWQTVNEMVSALRGRPTATVAIERGGETREVVVRPAFEAPLVAQHGVILDGALIAPIEFSDHAGLRDPALLVVQSVEPGSKAEALEIQPMDIVHQVDGRRFEDADALAAHLESRTDTTPVRITSRRLSRYVDRFFDWEVRELPGEDVRRVGLTPDRVVAR